MLVSRKVVQIPQWSKIYSIKPSPQPQHGDDVSRSSLIAVSEVEKQGMTWGHKTRTPTSPESLIAALILGKPMGFHKPWS